MCFGAGVDIYFDTLTAEPKQKTSVAGGFCIEEYIDFN
jgi:hypothetical protein